MQPAHKWDDVLSIVNSPLHLQVAHSSPNSIMMYSSAPQNAGVKQWNSDNNVLRVFGSRGHLSHTVKRPKSDVVSI